MSPFVFVVLSWLFAGVSGNPVARAGAKCGGYDRVSCKSGLVCKRRLGMILGEERAGICEPGIVTFSFEVSAPLQGCIQ